MSGTALEIRIADAIVTELLSGLTEEAFSEEFVPQRKYHVHIVLEENSGLNVWVVPRTVKYEMECRDNSRKDVLVDIGILERPVSCTDVVLEARLDVLMRFANEITDFFAASDGHSPRELDAEPTASFISVERDPVFDGEHVAQFRQFTSVVRLTYSVVE
jgi:hypothetical protein